MPALYGLVTCLAVLYCTVFRESRRYSQSTMDANATPASFTADLLSCSALTQLTGAEIAELFMGALANAGATIVETV